MASETSLDTRVEFRPTLIVGLGGTGHEVVARLKARFLETYGEDAFRIVRLISFDTADESVLVSGVDGQAIRLDKGTELVDMGHVPTPGIMKNLDKHPTIKSWLPRDLPARAITAGAQQIRPMGRLALYHHFEGAVRPRIEQAIRDLSNIRLRDVEIGEVGQITRSRGINVFIVTSACGGTGSGTFIDMAYLVRHFCMQQGVKEEYCFVTGVIVLPQAFATVTGDAIKANTYAALLELDHFTELGNFQADYPGGVRVEFNRRKPFTICYLVDAVNEHGKMLSGLSELAPMISESIFLQTASQIGDATKSVFDNVKALDQVGGDGHPTSYSGIGTASLVFPTQLIVDGCASRFLVDLVDKHLVGRTADSAQINASVDVFFNRSKISPEYLASELSKDPAGKPLRFRLDGHVLDKTSNQEIIRKTEALVQEVEDKRLKDLFQKFSDANLNRFKAEMIGFLDQDLRQILDAPDQGLQYALDFLRELRARLRSIQEKISANREQSETQLQQAQKPTADAQSSLANAVNSAFLIGKTARVHKARDIYLNYQQRNFTLRFELRIQTLALNLLADLNTHIAARSQEYDALTAKFSSARDRFARQAQDLANGRNRAISPLTYELFDLSDIDKYYTTYVSDISQQGGKLLTHIGGLTACVSKTYDQVYDLLLTFGRSAFSGVRKVKIEQVIQEKRAAKTADDRLEDLRQDSVPFWNYDPTRMADLGVGIESIIVVGVDNKSDSIYTGKERTGELLTTTRDPHSITVLHTRHGLPLTALQQFDDYRRRYEAHLKRKVSPVHIFDMGDPRRVKTQFALGETFGFIRQTGPAIYFIEFPSEHATLSRRLELGRGLPTALSAFMNLSENVDQVEKLVEQHIAKIGTTEARKLVDTYINREYSKSSERQDLERELRNLVREYRDSYL